MIYLPNEYVLKHGWGGYDAWRCGEAGAQILWCDSIINTAVASNLALGVCLHGPYHAMPSVDARTLFSPWPETFSCQYTTQQKLHHSHGNGHGRKFTGAY